MPVTVEIVGRRIHLTGWVGPDTSKKCKQIVGHTAKWDKTVHPNKFLCWTYPLDWAVCRQFRKAFGDELIIGPKLMEWAKGERVRHEKLVSISELKKFDLDRTAEVSPRLSAAMAGRPYQQVGAAYLVAARRAILADDPGLGKTLQLMAAAVEDEMTGPILVMAPSQAIQITWPTELAQWLPGENVYRVVGSRQQRELIIYRFTKALQERPDERHWLLANFEMLRAQPQASKLCPEMGPFKWTHTDKKTKKEMKGNWHHPYADLFETEWSMIVADESQKALITKTPIKMDQSQVRAGCGMLRIRENGMRVPLSGTPFRGKKENLWGTLNWIRPDKYTSYWNWVKRYFEVMDDGYSLIIGDLLESMEKEFYEEMDTVMLRRTKPEVAPDLPPKQYMGAPLDPDDPASLHGIWLPMESKQEKSYNQIVRDALADLDGGQLLATGVFAEMTRLKQFSSVYGDVETRQRKVKVEGHEMMEDHQVFLPCLPSNKFDWLCDWLDERGYMDNEPNGKVIIASQFTQTLNLFARELEDRGVRSHLFTGETSAGKRLKMKEEFQGTGGPAVFFLNTDAGGVSLTLDAADDLIFLDEKWIPDDQTQVEDRAHRISRMHQVRIWYLRSLGTIEESIGRVNEERDSMQKILLDGRRGVEFAKKLIGV